MVHQNALVLSDALRQQLENGGGTKETTRAIRANLGQNFVEYCRRREDAWCIDTTTAPAWWSSTENGAPRNMEELCSENGDNILGNFFKNWLWEMQVGQSSVNVATRSLLSRSARRMRMVARSWTSPSSTRLLPLGAT